MMHQQTLFAILLALLGTALLTACGGGGGQPLTKPDATEEPLAIVDNPNPTLREYLVTTLRLQAEANEAAGARLAALADPPDDPQAAYNRSRELLGSLGRQYGESAAALDGVTPPPEATDFHAGLLAVFRQLETALLSASAADDPADFDKIFAEEVVPGLPELANVSAQGQRLAITLPGADRDQPLNDYLASAIEARTGFATEFGLLGSELQAFLSSLRTEEDVDALITLVQSRIPGLEGFEERWNSLAPPPEAAGLHTRQSTLHADALDLQRDLLAAIREDGLDDLAGIVGQFQDLAVRSMELEAGWTELLIVALIR